VTLIGERIEIEVFEDEHLEISRFRGDESIEGGEELLRQILRTLQYDPDQPRVPARSGSESGQWPASGECRGAGADRGKVGGTVADREEVGAGSIAFQNTPTIRSLLRGARQTHYSPQHGQYVS
jgi:hypothetical protein